MLVLVAWILLAFLALGLLVGAFLLGGEATPVPLRALAERLPRVVRQHPGPLLVVLAVAIVHKLAVSFLDPAAAAWVRSATGFEFTQLILAVEGDFVLRSLAYHRPLVTALVVYFYLIFHAFMVLFTPIYVGLTQAPRVARTTFLAYGVIYTLALPFLLFFPSTNPYVYFGIPSPLEAVLPGAEALYYQVTTVDNTLPSLHVALAAAIGILSWFTTNRRFRALATSYAVGIVLAVLYIPVHWIVDVAGGLLLAVVGVAIARRLVDHPLFEVDEDREPFIQRVRRALEEQRAEWGRE